MDDFEYEVMQRKRLARQASHKKNGSKSKKCPLSTDRMTRKQWEARCGEIMNCQLGVPMTWEDFCKMDTNLQKEYLLDMIHRYSTTASDLAKMFGIYPSTVTKFCAKEAINIKFQKGKRMPKDKREEFERMFICEPTDAPFMEAPIVDPAQQQPDLRNIRVGEAVDDMVMTGFDLSFTGLFNRERVCNTILAMIPAGTNVKVDVKCSILA